MPEHQEIEWKESWRDEYLKWICGYANAHGGTLFIGKDDNGKVVGITDSKKLLEDLPNKMNATPCMKLPCRNTASLTTALWCTVFLTTNT